MRTIRRWLRLFILFAVIGALSAAGIHAYEWISDKTATSTLQVEAASYDPTPIIGLDAGHGGYDTGSISYDGVYEKDITLAITQKTGELLQEAGYSVVYTRIDDEVSWSDDNKDDLRTRVAIAEEAAADYYISIHTNASTYGDGASGFEAYLNYENETIAAMASSIESRGLKSTEDTSLYVIDSNSVPAMLLELGFITDSADAAYMSSEDGQNAIAQSIAQGIMEHL